MSAVAELIPKNDKRIAKLLNVLSVAIPVVVAILIGGIRQKIDLGTWTSYLPHLNGLINTLTSLALVLGLVAIKQKNIALHRVSMLIAFVLGAIFLVNYIIYHISNPSTAFGGQGWIRPVYYFLLISHILLSIGVVYFVLKALYYALSNQIAEHKKVVKWAYPIWLYVSISGVIVYLLISPYYVH
jgi:putative membrane protein